MNRINSLEDWTNEFTESQKLLKVAHRNINERIVAVQSGVPPQQFALQNQKTQQSLRKIKDSINVLSAKISSFVQKHTISVVDAQSYQGLLEELRQSFLIAQRKSEAPILKYHSEISSLMNNQEPAFSEGETELSRQMTTDDLLESNDIIIDQQDSLLDELLSRVRRIREQSQGVSDELDYQDNLIDRISDQTHALTARTEEQTSAMRSMKIKRKEAKKLYIIIIILVIILVLQLSTHNFGMGY
ncbi:hypothetical protein BLNAU_12271 [Blattamonas nauphoetae]|uniref:t-SNARE coiled-coil homology domain-containing protein n=1 Tax=Blattamonas nauphoetae TaxID=2049346 RepID=A0ABQ9XN92_9EUKA|nr:hypothetical protein BLNAU_12271 [Blattamonas nauphoetae]